MNTTIAVKPETLDLLKHVRHDLGAITFDETIRKLVLHLKKPKQSMFGRGKGKIHGGFVREELDRFS